MNQRKTICDTLLGVYLFLFQLNSFEYLLVVCWMPLVIVENVYGKPVQIDWSTFTYINFYIHSVSFDAIQWGIFQHP